ncbi:hypothetical protein [Corynebacterium antarcticum]|uniref:hypothetical protein n=1 Tax=Corynebacterium antarcticum TaxID=2800405 RepID=UPI002004B0A7|nr:hypothetical protein [Corynebacterium antarcticum]MCK7661962.1 hypothetical protein [Corynebacterium antarcticum]
MTKAPHLVREVWIRAKEPRAGAGGLTTDANTRVEVGAGGEVSFFVEPGPAILVLLQRAPGMDHVTHHSVSLLVTEGASTLAEAVLAAGAIEDHDSGELRRLLDAALTDVRGEARELGTKVVELRQLIESSTQEMGGTAAELRGKIDALLAEVAAAEATISDKTAAVETIRQQVEALVQQAREAVDAGIADDSIMLRHLGSDVKAALQGKADKGHTHRLSELQGVGGAVTGASYSADGNTVVVRHGDGRIEIADPTTDGNAATMRYVNGKVAGLATTSYVNGKVAGLATTSYVNGVVDGLATQSYVNSKVSGLTSTSDVDRKVAQATDGYMKIKVVDRAAQATGSGIVYLVKGN